MVEEGRQEMIRFRQADRSGNRICPAVRQRFQLIQDEFETSVILLKHKRDNVKDHRAAVIDLQAEKAARPAAPCASYCYVAKFGQKLTSKN